MPGSRGTTSSATRRPARSTGPTSADSAPDAAPTLAALPPEQAACALGDPSPEKDGWAGWNLSRARAIDALADFEMPPAAGCSEVVAPARVTYAGAVDPEAAALLDALPDGVVVADADGTVTVVNDDGAPAARPGRGRRSATCAT